MPRRRRLALQPQWAEAVHVGKPTAELMRVYEQRGRLGLWRRRAKISQEEAADILGLSRRTLVRWEASGEPLPPWHLGVLELLERLPDLELQRRAGAIREGTPGPAVFLDLVAAAARRRARP